MQDQYRFEPDEKGRRPAAAGVRQPYRKPVLERIRLAPDEVVLGACKNPGFGACHPPGHPPARLPGS